MYAWMAGARAVARCAFGSAAACFEGALAATAHLPEGRERQALCVDLTLGLRGVCVPLGAPERSLDAAQRALALGEGLGDAQRLTSATAQLINARYIAGDTVGAAALEKRALALADADGNRARQDEVRTCLGQTFICTGDYHRAISLLERNREVEDAQPERSTSTPSDAWLSYKVPTPVLSDAWLAWALPEIAEFSKP